jgi:hypothetical protein
MVIIEFAEAMPEAAAAVGAASAQSAAAAGFGLV